MTLPQTKWWLIVPESIINEVLNPSAELDLTGYTADNGAAIEKTPDFTSVGTFSIKITPDATFDGGVHNSITLLPNTKYTFSVAVKGSSGQGYVIALADSVGTDINALAFVADGSFARYEVTADTTGSTSYQLKVYKDNDSNTDLFYVDAFQCEQTNLDISAIVKMDGPLSTDYCDGSLLGCGWEAGEFVSRSFRLEGFPDNGRPINSSQFGFTIDSAPGMGMSNVAIHFSNPAQGDGSIFKRQVMQGRQAQLKGNFLTDAQLPDGLRALHALRSEMISLLSPERQLGTVFGYVGSGKMLRTKLYQQATGLDGKNVLVASSPLMGFNEVLSLRLFGPDPTFTRYGRVFNQDDITAGLGTGTGDGAAGLNGGGNFGGALDGGGEGGGGGQGEGNVNVEIDDTNYIIQKDTANNVYSNMLQGLKYPTGFSSETPRPDGNVYHVFKDSKGFIWAVGDFVNVTQSGEPNIVVNGITRFDGRKWRALGTGFGGPIDGRRIVEDSLGNIYICGNFTSVNGVSANRFAKFDGNTFSALLNGIDAQCLGMDIDSQNNIYITGIFTTVNSGATAANRIVAWDGVGYSALGVGANDDINTVLVVSDTEVYVGGLFTNIGGIATTAIGLWNTSIWATVGGGIVAGGTPHVDCIAHDNITGNIAFGGSFSHSASDGTATRITEWNGNLYFKKGQGFIGGDVEGAAYSATGVLYVVGAFEFQNGPPNDPRQKFVRFIGPEWEEVGGGLLADGWSIANLEGETFLISTEEIGFASVLIWSGLKQSLVPVLNFDLDLLQSKDNRIYIGGSYDEAGGVANTTSICYWSIQLSDYVAMGTGADGSVFSLIELANGDIVAGGTFLSMGGVANTQGIALWQKTTQIWLSINNINGSVLDMAVNPRNGDLYIVGSFIDAAGGASTQNIARFDGTNWFSVATSINGVINAIEFDQANNAYIGGQFTLINQVQHDFITRYDLDTISFVVMQNGTNGTVNDIKVDELGNVFVAGLFSQLGNQAVSNIGRWNGTGFFTMADGLNDRVKVLEILGPNSVLAGGVFNKSGTITFPDKAAAWNSSTWDLVGINFPGNAEITAIKITNTHAFFGFDTTGTTVAAG